MIEDLLKTFGENSDKPRLQKIVAEQLISLLGTRILELKEFIDAFDQVRNKH